LLLKLDITSNNAERLPVYSLRDIGIDERRLQAILFNSLDRLLPDDELLLVSQSRRWREEPDLLALDSEGTLYIFELKAWESNPENLLQALRYGQIFGSYSFDDLSRMYEQAKVGAGTLANAHKSKFGITLKPDDFNQRQTFVVMTNGLDVKTREAIQYWRKQKLEVRPWIYRIYKNTMDVPLLEMVPFRVKDNPYEDTQEGFYPLNTNLSNDVADDEYMLKEQRAAAFFSPWKLKIERLNKGDLVFLYRSGSGIVAYGKVMGKMEKRPYQGKPEYPDEEYSVSLSNFFRVEPPISAAEIKEITGNNYVFRGTMFSIDKESSEKLKKYIANRK